MAKLVEERQAATRHWEKVPCGRDAVEAERSVEEVLEGMGVAVEVASVEVVAQQAAEVAAAERQEVAVVPVAARLG